MPRSRRTFPCTFFKTPTMDNHGLSLPHNGFRRITTHQIQARQYAELRSPLLSDHAPFALRLALNDKNNRKPYLLPWSQYYQHYSSVTILAWNIMMRCKYNEQKNRYNNAYRLIETEEEYLQRMERVVQNLGSCIRRHQEVAMILLQEAPEDPKHLTLMKNWFEKYLPADFKLNLDATHWGILTLTNQQILPEAKKLNSVYSGPFFEMNTRKSTFVFPDLNTQLTNLHLPHDSSEEALELIITNLTHALTHHIKQNERYGSFIFTGDWNLPPEKIEHAATQAIENLFPHRIPVRCDITVIQSPEGHIKTNGCTVGVDGSLAVSYKLSHRDLPLVREEFLERVVELPPSPTYRF